MEIVWHAQTTTKEQIKVIEWLKPWKGINKEKVLSTKQEKLYTEEDLLNFGAFVRIEDKKEKRLFLIQDYFKKWLNTIKRNNQWNH